MADEPEVMSALTEEAASTAEPERPTDAAPPGGEDGAFTWTGPDGAAYRVLRDGTVVAHDGQRAPLSNLVQTHRQFGHLQQRWTQEAKPWLDFAGRYRLTPDLIPALERTLAQLATRRQAGEARPAEPEFPKDVAELYPELAKVFETMREQLQGYQKAIEQGGSRLSDIERWRQQQDATLTARETLGNVQRWLQGLAEQIPDLKDPTQQGRVFQVMYEENWPVSQITEANVRRVARDLFADRLDKRTQAREAFGEGAGSRLPVQKGNETEQLIRELIDAAG